jgi:hypothetical protein
MEVSGWLPLQLFYPCREGVLGNRWLGVWVGHRESTETVKERKSLALARNPTPISLSFSPWPVAIPTELFRL